MEKALALSKVRERKRFSFFHLGFTYLLTYLLTYSPLLQISTLPSFSYFSRSLPPSLSLSLQFPHLLQPLSSPHKLKLLWRNLCFSDFIQQWRIPLPRRNPPNFLPISPSSRSISHLPPSSYSSSSSSSMNSIFLNF